MSCSTFTTNSELAAKPDFVAKLHAAADRARHQQPARGRPPKAQAQSFGGLGMLTKRVFADPGALRLH
jgi:hypothetical protein